MPSTIVIRKKLDMTPGAVPTVVHRSQYDSDFTIIFELFARTGEFVIESGTTARLRGTKTSGTGYSVPIPLDIATKTVTITGDAQMTVAAGNNIFEVVLYLGDLEICSSNFVLAIERAAMDKDTITDATVVPELERLDEYIEQAADIAAREGAAYAESWAVGGTGKRPDEDTNNAKYWAEHAEGVVHGVTSFNGRTGAVVPETGDYKSEMIRRGNSTTTVEDTLTSLGSIAADLGTRMSTAEDTISSHGTRLGTAESDIDTAESDIDTLKSRATTAESAISSQGTRLTTAEGDIDALEGRATTTESNIATLQSTKVDMTTPLLNFDDTATDPLTDDGALANALRALAILDDVIPTGGGRLYLKKALTELAEAFNPAPTVVTYTTNNGTVTVRCKKIGVFVLSTWTITPSSAWGTGAGNRITCTFDNQIPIPASVFTGVELNGIFAHINSGRTFRAQNNTGGSLGTSSSYDVSIAYFTTNP